MSHYKVIHHTWLSKKPREVAVAWTSGLVMAILALTSLYWAQIPGVSTQLAASGERVFTHQEYWRAWSSLFLHGDFGHLLSNLLLFIPLSYFLIGHYRLRFFPIAGFLMGGVVNLFVLKTMSAETGLVGVSGVVYWMGAAWLTLYLFIERTESIRRRIGKVLVISAALFLPESFKPEISYLSHSLGFLFGFLSGVAYYLMARKEFDKAEEFSIIDDDLEPDFEGLNKAREPSEAIDHQLQMARFRRHLLDQDVLAEYYREPSPQYVGNKN